MQSLLVLFGTQAFCSGVTLTAGVVFAIDGNPGAVAPFIASAITLFGAVSSWRRLTAT